jgi:PAS domain S-box-containing protein
MSQPSTQTPASQKPGSTRALAEALRTPILVVDDVQDNRELLEELLRSEGYENILSAANGLEALETIAARPDVGLVLLDLMMPGMDGYEVCQRLSGSETTAHIPIIVITGGAVRRDEALLKSFERGAMDFLPKPVNEVELYGRVKSALLLYLERMHNREKTRALLESQQRYELAVNGVNDGIWDLNLATKEVYLSPQWKKNLGYEDQELASSMEVWDSLVHPEDRPAVLAAIDEHGKKQTPFYASEHRLKTKSGEYKWVFTRGRAAWDDAGKVVRMTGSTTDISQRRLLENQLRQAQQMESIGRLAAGVAHDFNNLLAAILGHASFMQLHLTPDSPLVPGLESITKASTRAAELCKQMLAYAGQGSYSIEQIDVNSAIADTLSLVNVSISKKINLSLARSNQPAVIKADVAQIRQVLMNLVLNAAEAIGENTGSISIRVSRLRPAPADLANAIFQPKAIAAEYVRVEVIDTGCGMSKETQEKIFEPFFTTKFTGRGLGLSAVLGIVKAHDGLLKISSGVGRGTTFEILLPLLEGAAAPKAEPEHESEPELWHGSGTVLLVDDEASVRESTRNLLTELGFRVLLAENGEQGLHTFASHVKEIVAVILDLTMPRLGGAEVFEQIRKIRPRLPVLLSSGYNEQNTMERFTGTGLAGFLQKPFSINDLASKLRDCLSAA